MRPVLTVLTLTSVLSVSAGPHAQATGCPDPARPVTCAVGSAGLAAASPRPLAARPPRHQMLAGPASAHPFVDSLNIWLTVGGSAALIADGAITQHLLKTYPGWGREADPLARPFVENGWPGQIVGGTLFIGADVALRYLLHRKGHHRAERWIAAIPIGYGTLFTSLNFGTLHEFRERRRLWER